MQIRFLLLISILLSFQMLQAAEAPLKADEKSIEAAVAAAPETPFDLKAMDLKLKLIDFIDCTNEKDPHEFKDQGTSSIAFGPAGKYRVTAGHRHAFFSYRFKSAGKDKPLLITIEYPDDADRNIYFGTHESVLSGSSNIDWSLETGVYTGYPVPLSNKMQYHTFIMWAQDEWPCVIAANFGRNGGAGAASRIWVHSIEEPLPVLKVDTPDPLKPRRLGHYNSLGNYLATRLYFGAGSKDSIKHMVDYFAYVGVNEISWGVILNNSYAFDCTIPSWGKGDNSEHLDKVLTAMDEKGDMNFVAGFALDNNFIINKKQLKNMSPAELKDCISAGFDEFLSRYGKYKSLKGIVLGAQYGITFADLLREKGILESIVKGIKRAKTGIEVYTYVGGKALHEEYFDGADKVSSWDVISRWEKSDKTWSDFLGAEIGSLWKKWNRSPADFKNKGLLVSEQYQPDDYRIFGLYAQQARPYIYYDVDNSQARSDIVNTNYANLWNTHFEGWFGLIPGYNFWYKKLWVAPDFNAPPPHSLAAFTRPLIHRDRFVINAGSWNVKYFGSEVNYRRFAQAFRSLPPDMMKDVTGIDDDTVKARWLPYKGKRYISLVNKTPFPAELTVDGHIVILPCDEISTIVDTGPEEPIITIRPSTEYRNWVAKRIANFVKTAGELKALDASAISYVFDDVSNTAYGQLDGGKPYAANTTLGFGLEKELELRKSILARPSIFVPRVISAPPTKGELDSWPKNSTDLKAETGDFLAGHLYFPNSWQGPKDLSARLRTAHDGTTLYLSFRINDDLLTAGDTCQIWLSKDNYKNWKGAVQKIESGILTFDIKTGDNKKTGPFTYSCELDGSGFLITATAKLSGLDIKPGEEIGFLLYYADLDGTKNLNSAKWVRKQALLLPHDPNFVYWGEDARVLGRLVLEK